MKIVALSNTHGFHSALYVPAGDLLVCAGDITANGDPDEVRDFDSWLSVLPHRHKVVIAGDADICLDTDGHTFENAEYLQDSGMWADNIYIWGSPWSRNGRFEAFSREPDEDLGDIWAKIPERTNILVTHCPPDTSLEKIVRYVGPRAHIYGHDPDGHGKTISWQTQSVNACICDHWGRPVYDCIELEI